MIRPTDHPKILKLLIKKNEPVPYSRHSEKQTNLLWEKRRLVKVFGYRRSTFYGVLTGPMSMHRSLFTSGSIQESVSEIASPKIIRYI